MFPDISLMFLKTIVLWNGRLSDSRKIDPHENIKIIKSHFNYLSIFQRVFVKI